MNNIEKGPGYYRNSRREMLAFLPETYSRVLEIGCGEGNFAANLKPDCEIWGVEINESAAKQAAPKMKNVLVVKYDDVAKKLPKRYFDLVICNDVIEHMEDPDAFLTRIKEKLVHEGYLVGSVPNVRYYKNLFELLFEKDWRYRDEGVLDNTHLRFFTEKSLRNTFRRCRYSIDMFQGVNSAKNCQSTLKRLVMKTFFSFIFVATMGTYRDVQFLQFGFRVRNESVLS